MTTLADLPDPVRDKLQAGRLLELLGVPERRKLLAVLEGCEFDLSAVPLDVRRNDDVRTGLTVDQRNVLLGWMIAQAPTADDVAFSGEAAA